LSDIRQKLFSIQKFQILALYTSTSAEQRVTDSYVFAWLENIYPFLNDSACWHQAFEDCFAVGEAQIVGLHKFLSARWTKKKKITFYELEDHYGIRGSRRPGPNWSQDDLVRACRYFHLHRQFDGAFWSALLESGQFPAEAELIREKFDPDSVRFE